MIAPEQRGGWRRVGVGVGGADGWNQVEQTGIGAGGGGATSKIPLLP